MMRTIADAVLRLLSRGRSWLLDYVYVGFWQIHGVLVRSDAGKYLQDTDAGAQPVLIIPGVYERWPFMHPVADRAHRLGHPVHVVEALGFNRGSIARMADLVTDYLAQRDLTNVLIVAHSKGGLIGKHVMADDGGARVSGMVAINTPFSGSVYAKFFLMPSIRAFAPSSKALQTLTENRQVNARITSVYSRWDPHIPGGSELAGARNIQLSGSGHFRVVAAPEVLDVVEAALAEGGGSAPAP